MHKINSTIVESLRSIQLIYLQKTIYIGYACHNSCIQLTVYRYNC